MRILIGHNHYQKKGGEDAVVRDEAALLREKGNEVALYERNNLELLDFTLPGRFKALWQLDWSDKSYDEIKRLIRDFRPEVAHFHNTFFMMTPCVYYACKEEGVAVVQSLHNFRWVCANALFYRDNHVCEDCLDKSPLSGVFHRCYHDSYMLSFLVTRMIKAHKQRNTLFEKVDTFITATEFTREKFIKAGLPGDKIKVKPNFVYNDPGQGAGDGNFALYVGRISQEKGVETLVQAWAELKDMPLKIAGEGPQFDELKGRYQQEGCIDFLGYVSDAEYDALMRKAKMIVIPSVCYENFPRIVAEACAYGIPIIASRLGSFVHLIDDSINGVLFEPGNADELRQNVRELWNDTGKLDSMRRGARNSFENRFEKTGNYQRCMEIYTETINCVKQHI